MSQEKITSIRINIKEGFMETRSEDGSGLRVDLATGDVLQQIPFGKDGAGATRRALAASQPEPEAPLPDPVEQASEAAPARREKSPAIVLPGRLKSTPVAGRSDGHGKPTAWAHFLAHLDGQEGAVLLSATFHNHTRDAALGMSAGDTLTAQGYLHPSRDSDRLSTFSVFRLIGQDNRPEIADQPEDESNLLDLQTFLARRRAAEGAHPPAPTPGG
jgi:hypothetical protein